VNSRTKVSKAVDLAMNLLNTEGTVVLAGTGPTNCKKVVTLGEIVKKEMDNVFTITKHGHRKIEEFWDPILEGLDPLVVTRQMQTVHFLITIHEIDTSESDVAISTKSRRKARRPRKPPTNLQGRQNAIDLGLMRPPINRDKLVDKNFSQ